MRVIGIDHVPLAMPRGGEDSARRFYAGVLGFEEIPKPAELAGRGRAVPISGVGRVHVADPFGNRIELVERRSS